MMKNGMELKTVNKIEPSDMKNILDSYTNFHFSNFELIGEGTRGCVYRYKNYAIKLFKTNDNLDGQILENLQEQHFFPKLYFYIPSAFMVSEFIEGTNLNETLKNFVKLPSDWENKTKKLIDYIFDKGFFPGDLNSGNLRIKKTGEIMIIDVGSFSHIESSNSFFSTTEIFKKCAFNRIFLHVVLNKNVKKQTKTIES